MKLLLPALIALLVAIQGNTIEHLVGKNYSSATLMIIGGGICLFLNCVFCVIRKQPIFPVNWKLQTIRLINNGISTVLLLESYRYLSAGSVGLVRRTDVPLLVIVSISVGERRSPLQFWLSLWSIFMILFLILDARFIDEEPVGFVYAFVAVLLVSLSYLLVKRSASIESPFVISNVNCLGIIIAGFFLMIYQEKVREIAVGDLWAFVVVGISLFLIYVTAVPLYRKFSAERARFPFVIGALATMALEMVVERKLFSASHIGLALLIAGMVGTISLNAGTPKYLYPTRKTKSVRNSEKEQKDTSMEGATG